MKDKYNMVKKIKHKKKQTKKVSISSEKVETNISNFDKLIGGGFEKNSSNIIAGGAGSGKSIFATQFLVEGIKKVVKVFK